MATARRGLAPLALITLSLLMSTAALGAPQANTAGEALYRRGLAS